ncbi:M2 family metallopeptidase, partial [Rheinheimera baltica]
MTPFKLSATAFFVTSTLLLSACSPQQQAAPVKAEQKQLTQADAEAFLADTEKKLEQLYLESNRAEWIYANFITEDTASLAADVNEKLTVEMVNLATAAAKFDQVALSEDSRRKLDKLKLALTLPAPQDAAKTAEMAKLVAELGGLYGKGKYCKADGSCLSLGDMSAIMASSRDYNEQLEMWQGWREISKPMRPLYQRLIALTNEGAKELGYADTGAMWRSKYDMPADDFAKELDRVWEQVKPLYESLHCHVRSKLAEQYGTDKVALDKPIPAHLLGNMWAQSWGNIYDLVAPQDADPGYDVT